MNVRIHVHFYAGFDDEFWSCNAGFCSPTPSVSSPPILPPLAEQKSSLHRQNTLFTKDHSYKSFQPLCKILDNFYFCHFLIRLLFLPRIFCLLSKRVFGSRSLYLKFRQKEKNRHLICKIPDNF